MFSRAVKIDPIPSIIPAGGINADGKIATDKSMIICFRENKSLIFGSGGKSKFVSIRRYGALFFSSSKLFATARRVAIFSIHLPLRQTSGATRCQRIINE